MLLILLLSALSPTDLQFPLSPFQFLAYPFPRSYTAPLVVAVYVGLFPSFAIAVVIKNCGYDGVVKFRV